MADQQLGFLILHGWKNHRPPGHWQNDAAAELIARGHRVEYPQLPDSDEPTVDAWRNAAEACLNSLTGLTIVVVCHSLSCLLWLGARPAGPAVERVLLVAPPEPAVLASSPEVAEFAALKVDVAADDRGRITIVASDNDEYCPSGAQQVFGDALSIPIVVLPGQGHINTDAGYGAWPSFVQWCEDPGVTLVARTS